MEQENNLTSQILTKDIVFIHGITSSGDSHIELCKHLTKQGYIFHHFDLPGHGSKLWEWNEHKFIFDDMLKFVDKYIKDNLQNKPFIIMGHSMGGGITLSTYPKFKEQIAAIILECPLSPAATNRSEENGEYTPTDVSRKTIKRAKHIAKLGWPKLMDAVRKWLGKDRCFIPLLADITKSEALEKINEGVKQVTVPTLLIVGEKDSVIPPLATSDYFGKNIRELTINKAIGSGHNPFRDTPDQFYKFIDGFLNKINK